ncbi:hypothetical protein [Glycomyces arizonensis]|uniref:hypothetical protein n=1 Tax=Glycomyces arizonensis TaxID=256035 RepID=UPI0012EBE1F6|nr:hypothetical protein [Glycomyces arizonensis]
MGKLLPGKDLAEVVGLARFEERVAELTDPRGAQGRWYPLSAFVAVALAGLLCGRNTPVRWAADAPDAVVRTLCGIGLEVGDAAWWSLPSYESRESGHGRSETRTVKILAAGGGVRLPFPGLAQIARIRRWTRDEATGEVTHHVMF